MIGNLSHIDQLNTLLRQGQMRHEVISSNIANVNTRNFKAKEIEFGDVLSQLTGKSEGEIVEIEGLVARQDGNNVDMDKELSKLTKNSLAYQTFAQIVASKLSTMRTAISGRS